MSVTVVCHSNENFHFSSHFESEKMGQVASRAVSQA